jgi:3-oxoacyl-[acyl-carrier-protein] synthase-3
VFGLGLARGLVGAGVADTVLVIGVETLSRIVDYTDRNTCVLFGDGAGAAVIQACETGVGLHAVDMHSDGELGEVLEVPAGISKNPASDHTVAAREHYIRMQGKKLFPFAVRSMEDSTRRCAEAAGWSPADIDLFIPHQANLRIIEGVRERLGLAEEKAYVNIERYGNTSSASIPIALDECVRTGRLKPGDKLAMAAFGGGATWGATAMTWTLAAQRAPESAARHEKKQREAVS